MGILSKMSILTGTSPVTLNRRQFLVTTAVAGGVFMIGLTPADRAAAGSADGAAWAQSEGQEFTALISIRPDNVVVARSTSPDMGNGTFIGTPMMVCEELRCDWALVKGEFLPANRDVVEGGAYSKSGGLAFFSGRTTGKAVMTEIMQLAASTRERLRAAAAAKWGVALDQVTAEMSMLTNAATGEKIPYADVAVAAAAITLEAEPTPRPQSEWTFLAKELPKRMNLTNILNGSQIFGIDVQVPGMVYAAIRQAPAQGGKVKSVDKDAVLGMPGVRAVVVVDPDAKTPGLPEGVNAPFGLFAANARTATVAVIADHFWQAQTALEVLPVEWDLSAGAAWKDTKTVYDAAMAAVNDPKEPNIIANVGDAGAALAGGADLTSEYLTPYMDHVNMEPLNGTCLVTKDRVEAWLPTQHPQQAIYVIADETGVPPANVHINQAWIGTGLGRRVFGDDARLVAAVAALYPDVPVKVIWTREESMRQGRYRNLISGNFKGKLGSDGMPEAVQITVAGGTGLGLEGAMLANSPYSTGVKNWNVQAVNFFTNLQLGPWRGPVYNSNAYMIETFINEMAEKAGQDAIEYRRKLLANYEDKSWIKLLDVVAEKSGWGNSLEKGLAQGVAISNWGMEANPNGGPMPFSGTTVAMVLTVEVTRRGEIYIPQVDLAFDTGGYINEGMVRAGMEGGTIIGLSSGMFEELNISDGKVVEGNLDTYRVMRQNDTTLPGVINVHFEGLSGHERFSEIGEPPVGPPPAALAHAVFKLTGTWMRQMPFSKIAIWNRPKPLSGASPRGARRFHLERSLPREPRPALATSPADRRSRVLAGCRTRSGRVTRTWPTRSPRISARSPRRTAGSRSTCPNTPIRAPRFP